MKKILENKINQCEMWSRFFKEILDNDCEELRKCVAKDLGYEDSEDIDKHLLFSDDARNTYWKLNSGHSKTRNWLIVKNMSITVTNKNNNVLGVGDLVEFKGQDSYFKGTIVSIFTKLDGKSVRCVVQDSRGLLLIKNPRDAILVKNENT